MYTEQKLYTNEMEPVINRQEKKYTKQKTRTFTCLTNLQFNPTKLQLYPTKLHNGKYVRHRRM